MSLWRSKRILLTTEPLTKDWCQHSKKFYGRQHGPVDPYDVAVSTHEPRHEKTNNVVSDQV